MGDEQHRLLQAREQCPQILLQAGANHRVESGERLVHEQHRRIEHQGAHEAYALALPAGELARKVIQKLRGEPGERRELGDPAGDALRVPALIARHEHHVLVRGEMRKETAFLDDIAHAEPERLPRSGIHRHAADEHPPAIRSEETDHEPEQGRLAAAARADQRETGPGPDLEVGGLERLFAVELLGDALEHDGRGVRILHWRYNRPRFAPLASGTHSLQSGVMMMSSDVDVLIIGAGQAGVPLAHALVEAGRSVILAERRHLGGSCINFGCTPTKAAIASARLAHDARRAAELGVRIRDLEVDFGAVIRRARTIAVEARQGLEKRFAQAANPALLRGHARLAGRKGDRFAVQVGERTATAREVVLDTGTRTRVPAIPGLRAVRFLHAGNWLDHEERPEHLLVLGGGVVAVEMAQFYRRMGSEVTILERGERILGGEDEDVSSEIQAALSAEGIEFRLATATEEVIPDGAGVRLRIRKEGGAGEVRGTQLFVATGRTPNTDDLGLETVGVKTSETGIVIVDERLQTTVPGIWAAGDIRGGPQFTHTSWDDFRILLAQMTGRGGRTTQRIVPYAVFMDPELGRVGMGEREARASGRVYDVHRYEMRRNGRARERGTTSGFIKVIVERETNQVLGATALAEQGAELVHLFVDVMNAGAPATVIRDAVHIHPTLAEAVQSAVANVS